MTDDDRPPAAEPDHILRWRRAGAVLRLLEQLRRQAEQAAKS